MWVVGMVVLLFAIYIVKRYTIIFLTFVRVETIQAKNDTLSEIVLAAQSVNFTVTLVQFPLFRLGDNSDRKVTS